MLEKCSTCVTRASKRYVLLFVVTAAGIFVFLGLQARIEDSSLSLPKSFKSLQPVQVVATHNEARTPTADLPPVFSKVVSNPRILFYHLHKCGGSTITALAKRNIRSNAKNRVGRPNNWDNYDGQFHRKIENQSCKNQAEAISKSNYTYIAPEYGFHLLFNCTFNELVERPVITLMTIREPISRLASEFTYNARRLGPGSFYTKDTPRAVIGRRVRHDLLPNFQVRHILNLTLPRSNWTVNLTRQHLQHALSLLDGVDLVIPMERLCEAQPLFRHFFGWSNFTALMGKGKNRQVPSSITTFEKAVHKELAEEHSLDLELWREANRRFDETLSHLVTTNITAFHQFQACPELRYNYIPFDKIYQVDGQDKLPGGNSLFYFWENYAFYKPDFDPVLAQSQTT